MEVVCDDSGKWAVADLALATIGLFFLANSEGRGIGAYAATTGTAVFGASSIIGFRRAHACRCLHRAWLEQAQPR